MLKLLVVGAGGGLGRAVLREALGRGAEVSVLVRSVAKFSAEAAADVPRLAGLFEGTATDPASVAAAATAAQATVVIGCMGGDEAFARGLAEGAARAKVPKTVTVAGATNLKDADGVTPLWHKWATKWPPAGRAFKAHGAAIAATREVAAAHGTKYVVFCPPYMQAKGAVSSPPLDVIVDREGDGFISYEDAAWIMLEAASRPDFDNQLITGGRRAAAGAGAPAGAPAAKAEL